MQKLTTGIVKPGGGERRRQNSTSVQINSDQRVNIFNLLVVMIFLENEASCSSAASSKTADSEPACMHSSFILLLIHSTDLHQVLPNARKWVMPKEQREKSNWASNSKVTCHAGEVGTETTKYNRKLDVNQCEIEISTVGVCSF